MSIGIGFGRFSPDSSWRWPSAGGLRGQGGGRAPGARAGPRASRPEPPEGVPREDEQSNLSDPDSRLMRKSRRHEFRPSGAGTAVKEAKADWLRDMTKKLDSEEGRALYRLRQQTVEPVFGVIKAVLGFTGFSLRGSTRWPAGGTWWRWPTTASACTSSCCRWSRDGVSGPDILMPMRRHGSPVPEIDVPGIVPNPSSPSHPISTVLPADKS